MNRRSFLTGLIAAPVVIRTAGLLMPIKPELFRPYQLVGDVIYNRSPDINDCVGWLCTEQGSPGIWAELRPSGSALAVIGGLSQPPLDGGIYRDASYRRVERDWPFVLDIPNRRGVAQFG
jgi:hypothetical protein